MTLEEKAYAVASVNNLIGAVVGPVMLYVYEDHRIGIREFYAQAGRIPLLVSLSPQHENPDTVRPSELTQPHSRVLESWADGCIRRIEMRVHELYDSGDRADSAFIDAVHFGGHCKAWRVAGALVYAREIGGLWYGFYERGLRDYPGFRAETAEQLQDQIAEYILYPDRAQKRRAA